MTRYSNRHFICNGCILRAGPLVRRWAYGANARDVSLAESWMADTLRLDKIATWMIKKVLAGGKEGALEWPLKGAVTE